MSQGMISLTRDEVPGYLQSSPYFENAFQDSDDASLGGLSIEVPKECFKATTDVQTLTDLRELLQTVRFWLIPEFIENSSSFFGFIINEQYSLRLVTAELGQEFPFLARLCSVLEPDEKSTCMERAVKTGLLGLIRYMHCQGDSLCSTTCNRFTSLAAAHGHLDCLAYGLQNGCRCVGDECTLAAKGRHVKVFKYCAVHRCTVTTATFALVASLNQLELVKFLHERGEPWDSSVTSAAVRANALPCLRYLVTHGCPCADNVCVVAARNGSMECLIYLHECGHVLSNALVKVAIKRADVQCLRYVLRHGCTATAADCVLAASLGRLDCLMVLHDHGVALTEEVVRTAIKVGSLSCLEYALSNDFPMSADACVWAAVIGRLDMLTLVHTRGAPFTAAVTRAACTRGSMECLEYALNNNCPYDADICEVAVRDSLDCLVRMHAHGAALTQRVVEVAAEKGHLNCLRYVLSQGCLPSAAASIAAARNDHIDCLKFLHMSGAPMTAKVVAAASWCHKRRDCLEYAFRHTTDALGPADCAYAAHAHNLSYLKTLHERGVKWDITTCEAAIRRGSLNCLKYAVLNGCPLDASLSEQAALLGRIDMLVCLRDKYCPWDARTTAAAVVKDNPHCLQFAVTHNCPFEVPAEVLDKSPRCREYMAYRNRNRNDDSALGKRKAGES